MNPEARPGAEEISRTEVEAKIRHTPPTVLPAAAPAERFVTLWENERSLSLKNKSEAGHFLAEVKLDVAEQEKRLAAEQEELAGYRELRPAGRSEISDGHGH